jgi:hypothetical protein
VLSLSYKDACFQVADKPGAPAFFLFGVRKSGSSILNSMCHALADMNGVNFVDIPGVLFQKGHKVPEWQRDAALCTLVRPGNLYGGFRNFPFAIQGHEIFAASKKVLQVRDPRDALVSEYFSNAHSHSLPTSGAAREDLIKLRQEALASDIENYVRRTAPRFKQTLREYLTLKPGQDLKILRYEACIMRKRELLKELCSFFGWTATEAQLDAIVGWADIVPAEERPTEFIRRVRPGDHVEKLRPRAIKYLNELFAEEMAHFGYK